MNQRQIPAPPKFVPDFDPLTDYPDDVERLVAEATKAGYKLTPRDAATLWRRHSGDVCASWLAIAEDEQDIVPALLKHAEVLLDAADLPTPPEGYENWLDFAVVTMDTRAEEQDRQVAGTPVSRQSMRDAVLAELVALRRKAGEQ